VEIPVESASPLQPGGESSVQVRMLGPITVSRDGRTAALPASRKARALLAYLALAPAAVTRSQLCELLWDVPNDPRGELRWCLSKIRLIVDGRDRRRVHTHDDTIQLDLAGCFVDAIEIARATKEGVERLVPRYSVADFFRAFQFDSHGEALFRKGAKRIGMA
jgi:DNA-binding SARP family transcriptional activator